jgi:GT2 family glycosyltransferase
MCSNMSADELGWNPPSGLPRVQIIILNWNRIDDTLRCIESLEGQSYPNFRIVVVDNGSTDSSSHALDTLADSVELIRSPQNLGYTGGNNLALHEAFALGADYVWLFNNDALAERDALAQLVAICEANPAIGLASPLVSEADYPNTKQHGCGLFDLDVPSYMAAEGTNQVLDWQTRFADRIAVHGTALLIRRSLYESISGLDDAFFAYWEDIDYSIRSAKAGFRNVVVVKSRIYHESKPTKSDPDSIMPYYYYFMARNELLMWRKFCSGPKFARVFMWTLRRQLLQIARMPRNVAGINAILAGLWHGLRGVGGRYDPVRQMPWPARALIIRFHRFWLRLLGGQARKTST